MGTESRPWWKLSWPAVVAGLLMCGALLVKNLETKSMDFFTSVGSGGLIEEREFPLICETKQITQFQRMVHLGKKTGKSFPLRFPGCDSARMFCAQSY